MYVRLSILRSLYGAWEDFFVFLYDFILKYTLVARKYVILMSASIKMSEFCTMCEYIFYRQ